ncbi:MAG: radical SAM family heme chaperone HemW [Dokdonella sp.]
MLSPPLSLYIHIPWCVKKCPYCDFNSHAQRDGLPVDEYVAALLADLDGDIEAFAQALAGRPLHSVFFGGGTPSLFAPDAIARIIDGVTSRIALPSDAEVTLETNPGTVEHGRFDGYRSAGVNRISFGIQSFDDAKLQRLGRIHSAVEAERAVREAQDAGIANINVDLMYALPEQTEAQALHDIERAVALQPTHVSHYQLTLEPNTPFAASPPPLPDEDSAWTMQESCQQALSAAGFAQYEVSAYARGDRQCRHNLNYWQFGDYLGIGAGAHGKLSDAQEGTVKRRWKQRLPRSYLAAADQSARTGGDDVVEVVDLPYEFMMNALRLNAGVPITWFAQRSGLSFEIIAAPIAEAHRRGWLESDDSVLRPTDEGRRLLNNLVSLFLP